MAEPANETTSSQRPLKVGLMLPDTELEMGGSSARWHDLMRMATQAEEMGFDSIWVSDHLIFRFESHAPQGVWECWSLLAGLAAVTQRVELGPLVSCTSFRNPALLAKMAATLEEISGGRLILGLGAGWHAPEYAAFGYPFDHRVSPYSPWPGIVRAHRTVCRPSCILLHASRRRVRSLPRQAAPPLRTDMLAESSVAYPASRECQRCRAAAQAAPSLTVGPSPVCCDYLRQLTIRSTT